MKHLELNSLENVQMHQNKTTQVLKIVNQCYSKYPKGVRGDNKDNKFFDSPNTLVLI